MNSPTPQPADNQITEALELLADADNAMRALPERKEGNYIILGETILYLRVCSSMSVEDTLRAVNEVRPPGTSNNEWVYTDEPLPGSGDSRTVKCADAEGKKHYVFNC